MIQLPITLTIAGASGLLALLLAYRVSTLRMRHKISIGDAGNDALLSRMRAHANFSEYTPFFLILLALLELARGSALWMWAGGALFIVGRIAHMIGMDRPAPNFLRIAGTVLTWLLLGAFAAVAVVAPYGMRAPGSAIVG